MEGGGERETLLLACNPFHPPKPPIYLHTDIVSVCHANNAHQMPWFAQTPAHDRGHSAAVDMV